MVMLTLYAKQKKRQRCIEQTFGLYGRRWGWDDLREQHQNMYIINFETDHQSRLDAWDKCLGLVHWKKLFYWHIVDLQCCVPFCYTKVIQLNTCVCVCVLVALWCLTLHNSMDYNPPGSSAYGILQARILEWVDIFFSRGPSWPRDQTQIFCTAGRFLTMWATREALYIYILFHFIFHFSLSQDM